ncbi:MAG: DNA-binding response regulator [Chloroflexi bacterium]|nr:MAG: DNA-binding response regulator [Chloroflexota bacterium]MBL1197452.1 DNA-binding response regulator [Chloroflexota bacterium]NOH14747.1 response regulator transcription factor [Chloroflexota bacterium]
MSNASPGTITNVFIYSPFALLRSAWKSLLADQAFIRVIGDAHDLATLGARAASASPHTIFIDDPGLDKQLVERLQAQSSANGLLVLGVEYPLADLVQWMQAGVTGFVSRDAPVSELARAMIATGRGEMWLPPSIAGKALAALARGEHSPQDDLVEPLSERETDVLRLLVKGMANKDIAQTLILSVRTVEAHLRSVYGKLGVHSRTEAALWAVRNGYFEE